MKHDRFFASFKITVLLLALLAGQAAWAETNVTLSEDPDIPEGTAGHWYVNMSKDRDLWLTLSADDLAAGKGTFKVYDDGGKNGNHSKNCHGILHITVPVGNIIQASGTAWTKSGSMMSFLGMENSQSFKNSTVHLCAVQSTQDGEPTTFGPVVTYKDKSNQSDTDGQYLTILFQSFSDS